MQLRGARLSVPALVLLVSLAAAVPAAPSGDGSAESP